MMKNLLYSSVVWLMVSCNSGDTRNETDRLKESLDTFNQAFREADVDRLSSMITENYTHTNGSWKAFGKTQWLSYMKKRSEKIRSGVLKVETYEMTETKMLVNGSSAFVTGKIIVEGIDNEERFRREIRVSNYWVIDKGGWKRAGFHDVIMDNPRLD